MRALQKTAEEFIGFLDTYTKQVNTPITPEELKARGFRLDEEFTSRIKYDKGDSYHGITVRFFRQDLTIEQVEVEDWPRSHCSIKTVKTIEQLNMLLRLMGMETI